jgi:hypothetical protein
VHHLVHLVQVAVLLSPALACPCAFGWAAKRINVALDASFQSEFPAWQSDGIQIADWAIDSH